MFHGLLTYFIASIGVFFQQNLQYIYPWWKDKPLLTTLIFSIPVGYCYLTSWTYFTNTLGSVWSTRFLFFGFSYLIFPILAYNFLNETPFTLKTLLCTFLSVIIILIQYKL
jgi:hypothetical protein